MHALLGLRTAALGLGQPYLNLRRFDREKVSEQVSDQIGHTRFVEQGEKVGMPA